jgi:hypothetical protein
MNSEVSMRLLPATLALSLLLVNASPSSGAAITFDDLPQTFDSALASPYQGFDWQNFRYYSFTANAGFPTWQNGIVSQPNAAYSGGEIGTTQIIGTISSATPFDFVSAYLGSPNYATMNLTVQGLQGSTVAFSQVVSVNNNGADPFTFNFINIDSLRLFGSDTAGDPCGTFNCSQFTVDNLQFAPANSTIPEPATLLLVGGGLVALRRRLKKR